MKAHTKVTPKMTIPAPSDAALPARAATRSASRSIPTSTAISTISAQAYRKAIRAFYDAGCRYLQLDDTAWSMICDPKEREDSQARGDDPDTLPANYARMTNEALADKPADMTITMHSCRGNFRSTFIAAAATSRRGAPARRTSTSTAISWNTTPTAPAASSRCGSCPRARSQSCSAS